MGDTTNESEDHNWRQRNNTSRTREAVYEGNWPHPEEQGGHDIYINNQHPHNAQISRKTDGHQIINIMDNSLRNRLRAIHLNEWIPIRDELDEEPPDRSQLQRPHTISGRPIPARAVANETMGDDVARRITIDYGVTRRTLFPELPPPRYASEATGLSDEEDETKHLSRVMSGDIGQDLNPPAKQPSPSTTESPTDPPQQNPNDPGNTNNRDTHDSFRDILETKPVLPKATPDARDTSDSNDGTDEDDQGSADDISTTPFFTGHGREEGAGPYYSSDSGGLSTGKAGRHGREVRRPESVILHVDSYVGLTDFRRHRDLWVANADHICRTCHDGSRCWYPTSHECQRHRRALENDA